jgi:molybdopterin-guanine dinucleotide biosynthesis protein A
MAIQAFIQAGGRSSRMGTDKAWLEISGRTMIEHVLAAATPVAASPCSIIIYPANPNAERYASLAGQWNMQLLHDLHDHQGPLGGIHTALKACAANDSALILACDLPFLTAEFLGFLCQEHQIRAPQVTVPLGEDGRLQPLAAVYDQSCLAVVEERLTLRELKVDRLFNFVRTERIAFQEFAHLPGARKFFLNINTMEDWLKAIDEKSAEDADPR